MNIQFYRGMVTDGGGDELLDEAYLTFGSEDGEGVGDCDIRIYGGRAREAAHLISATADLLAALRDCLAVCRAKAPDHDLLIERAEAAIKKATAHGLYRETLLP